MEKGNEGDEIIFLAFAQIECRLPDNITSVGQIGADLLVELVARSLFLICGDEVKFPLSLPKNIASRHRICTSIATKIKDLGFPGDCGYNQLLYPVENQTRDLLTWIVEKLPRSEEEGAQEVLGANAQLNRRITLALLECKQNHWRLPTSCSGMPLRNIYYSTIFRTIENVLDDENASSLTLFQNCAESKVSIECSIYERHAWELVSDSSYALQLERDFDLSNNDTSGLLDINEGTGDLADKSSVISKLDSAGSAPGSVLHAAKMAVRKVVQKGKSGSAEDGSGEAKEATNAGGVAVSSSDINKAIQAKLLEGSLQDLIHSITSNHESVTSNKAQVDRGTRFSHATEFAEESSVEIGNASGGPSSGMFDVSPAMEKALAQTSQSGGEGGSTATEIEKSKQEQLLSQQEQRKQQLKQQMTSPQVLARRAQEEAEEKLRQEELDALRAEMQQKASDVENTLRQQNKNTAFIKQLEAELAALLEETDEVEKEVLLKKKSLELLPSARENIEKLQEECGTESSRLVSLAEEWEELRKPMAEMVRQKEEALVKRRERGHQMVEEIKVHRAEMVTMIQDLKQRQDRAQILSEERAKLPKNINRAIYTHRIMDITASIVKQNVDIGKITSDIRDLQKTINLNTNTLQRADAITEELIYSAASDKNDPVMVDTYRRLKTLRSKFEDLVGCISKTGQQEKLQRDLETKIDQEKTRISANNAERIKADLNAIIAENAQLVSEIKSKAGKH